MTIEAKIFFTVMACGLVVAFLSRIGRGPTYKGSRWSILKPGDDHEFPLCQTWRNGECNCKRRER